MVFTPLDPTKAEVRVNQDGPELEFDFYIPRGNKGDPGGFVQGTDLSVSTNLNDIKTPGLYRNWTASAATPLNNYPVSNASSVLEVLTAASPTDVIQRLTPVAGGATGSGLAMYVRRFFGGTWTTWRAYTSARVDQTAGRAIYQWDDVNAREQLVYGDTGWRNVAADLSPSDFAGTVFVRRQGGLVTVHINVTPADVTRENATIYTLPSGFRPDNPPSSLFYAIGRQGNSLKLTQMTVNSSGALAARTATNNWVPADGAFQVQATFPTSQTWPTTLPGIASGTIPNA